MVKCVRNYPSNWAAADQYNFVMANPERYESPIPCRGKLGFFEVKI